LSCCLWLAEGTQVGGEAIDRAQCARMVVAKDTAAADEGVFIQFSCCLWLAQQEQVLG